MAAWLTPATAADNETAPVLRPELPAAVRFLLGDTSSNAPDLHQPCAATSRVLVTLQRGPYPHADAGVDVRRMVHALRSRAIEKFNGQFKATFDADEPVPTRGLRATRRFALGAVLVYQLTVWYRFETGLDLRVGLKPFLRAA